MLKGIFRNSVLPLLYLLSAGNTVDFQVVMLQMGKHLFYNFEVNSTKRLTLRKLSLSQFGISDQLNEEQFLWRIQVSYIFFYIEMTLGQSICSSSKTIRLQLGEIRWDFKEMLPPRSKNRSLSRQLPKTGLKLEQNYFRS